MKLNIAQVIGLNTDQKAAQVSCSQRDGDNTFLAVLLLICDDAFTKGRQALSELEDFYFEFEGTTAEKLTATFAEAEKKFSGVEANFCLVAIAGKALYLIGKGQVEIYLKRLDQILPLLPVGAPSQLISGFISEGDRLLLSTKSLITFLGSELEKSLTLPIADFEEEVGGKIGASDLEDKGLAALALEVEGENLEISPIETQETVQPMEKPNGLPKTVVLLLQILLDRTINLSRKWRMYFPKSGRNRLILAIVLIVIISLGAGYKYMTGREKEKNLQFSQILQAAQEDFNSAKGIASLNPTEAKNKLDSAKDKVNKALSLKVKDKDARNLQNQLEQEYSSILKQASVAEFPVFLDLSLVKKDFRAERMNLSAGKLLVLDPDAKTLVTIDLAKKSNQILAGSEDLGEATVASLNGGLAFVYSVDKGILRIDTTSSKLSVVSKKDEGWSQITDIYGFAGNVYALDSGKKETPQSGQIWKYLSTTGGYSDKRSYLTKDTTADFSGVLRMQIESSIYVLKAGGEMLRFTRGEKDNFSYGGLDKGVKDPKSFFVSSDTDNLYLLDSGNSRLLILSKTGEYKGQLEGDKFAAASDLAVDEKNKKVYLLEGSKVFQVDLK